MFGWLFKYIRRIDVMGVGVEFRDPRPAAPSAEASPILQPAPPPKSYAKLLSSNPANRTDLASARKAFLDQVDQYAGAVVRGEYAAILDELIQWSEHRAPALTFVPHDGQQALIKFCLPGMNTHLWSAWPRKVDGAKLHVMTDPHPRFPEPLRELGAAQK